MRPKFITKTVLPASKDAGSSDTLLKLCFKVLCVEFAFDFACLPAKVQAADKLIVLNNSFVGPNLTRRSQSLGRTSAGRTWGKFQCRQPYAGPLSLSRSFGPTRSQKCLTA
eukprot:2148540-Amphidinium_carterae.1